MVDDRQGGTMSKEDAGSSIYKSAAGEREVHTRSERGLKMPGQEHLQPGHSWGLSQFVPLPQTHGPA